MEACAQYINVCCRRLWRRACSPAIGRKECPHRLKSAPSHRILFGVTKFHIYCRYRPQSTYIISLRMRSSLVVWASDCQCTSCNGPGFDPSIRRHSGIWGAADEAVLNKVRKYKVHIYLEYHSFCPLTRIGTPHPLSASVSPPGTKGVRGEVHTRLRVRG